MAAPSHNHNAVPQDTLITIKVSVNDSLKKLKLPLRDLGANVLPDKVREAYTRHRECGTASSQSSPVTSDGMLTW